MTMASTPQAVCTLGTLIARGVITAPAVATGSPAVLDDREVLSAVYAVRREDLASLRPGDLVVIASADLLDAAKELVAADIAGVAIPDWLRLDAEKDLNPALIGATTQLFTISPTVRLAEIAEVISAARAAPETTRFQRSLHMQQLLVDALLEDPPVDAVIRQLAQLTGGIAGISADDGNVEAASGVLPFVLLRQEASQTPGDGVIEVAGWVAVARPLRTLRGEPQRWLFVGRREPRFATSFTKAAVSVAASLLDASRRIGEIAAEQDLVTRAYVLRQALETEPYDNSDLLATRIGALGVDFVAPVRVVEVRRALSLRHTRGSERGLRDHVLAAFPHASLLVLEHPDGATVLAQCTAAMLDASLDRLLRAETGLLIGIGRPMRRVGETRVSWHDASLAAQAAARTKDKRIMRYDDFDLATRMLADVNRTDMSYWVDELLAPLRKQPQLLEAVAVYFDHDLDVMSASRHLQIHHNTLRYRLGKAEKALGGPILSPARITSLHLALASESSAGASAPLRPSETRSRQGADIGDTDVLHGGAVAPVQLGVGEQPELD
jgi:PucR C-terminal helix-turn-helix domain